ncbi:aminotransferase class IV [Methylonatrum kenyense]|uniref:aminotransferase class IV n=1 Tax=Methylonatrum kenyense TaxID=455253 RepID=UPI0020BFF753|nr:aminotransferase class IV [Methylonatrum kenyense]MCK8514924.1 aminotransferase class IV [Methylonatrum kenyense]
MQQDQQEPVVYLNGEYLPASRAGISVFDQGFLLGDGVFDVVSAWKGSIFKLRQHVNRFFDSLQAAHLHTSLNREQWGEAIIETVRRNGLDDASIRFIITRGVPEQVVADPRVHQPTEVIWAAPYIFLGDEQQRSQGIRLMVSQLRGFASDTLDPRYKCLSRMHFQLAKVEASAAGYDDLVWLNKDGFVAEGPASNLFMIRDGILYTPAVDILHGITRQTFLELAERAGVPVELRQLTVYDLCTADEVFTTSTAGGALPVREISGRTLRGPAPGPITRELDRLYWASREAGEHGTPIHS